MVPTRRDPSWEDVRKKAQAIQKQNSAPHVLSRGDLLAEKTKKKLEEAAQSGSVDDIIDPLSLVRRHVKWKMVRTKKIGEMTTEAAKEIAEKIVSDFQLTIRIIFLYFVNAMILLRSRRHRDPSSPMDVRMFSPLLLDVQSTLDVSMLLESVSRSNNTSNQLHGRPTALPRCLQKNCSTHQIRDQLEESTQKNQMQSQGLALPLEPLVGPSGPRVSTKESCVDLSGNDPETGDSNRCGLYIEANPACLVALGRVYEGSTVVHNTPLLPGQVKVGVEEVKDPDVPVLIPTDELCLRQNHLKSRIRRLHGMPPCSRSLIHTSRSTYSIKTSPKLHTVMMAILPKEHLVVWFCSLHNRPDNYLKGIINNALKGLDDAPQPKPKAAARWIIVKCNRQKGSTECGYYVMHWMSAIILGIFRNNWEAYFNDPRPLETEIKGASDPVGIVLSPS
ncbi:hypothetical protein HKD37_19G052766 [Glycine soja]